MLARWITNDPRPIDESTEKRLSATRPGGSVREPAGRRTQRPERLDSLPSIMPSGIIVIRVRRAMVGLLLALLVGSAGPAGAQSNRPVVTDRPSQGTGTVLLPPADVQLELGYSYQRLATPDFAVHDAPELLVRLGVLERVEARLTLGGWSVVRSGEASETGLNDVRLGAKLAVLQPSASPLAASVLVDVSLPTGSDGFTSDHVNSSFLALFDLAVSERVGLTMNVGPRIERSQAGTDVAVDYVVGAGGAIDDRVGWFGELFGSLRALPGEERSLAVQTGVSLRLMNDLQIDARIGRGLDGPTPRWVFGAGLGLRLPR